MTGFPVSAKALYLGAMLGLVGVVAASCWALKEQGVEAQARRVLEARSPLIASVEWSIDSGASSLWVELEQGSTNADARTVWCEVLRPARVDETVTSVYDHDDIGEWPPPADCADPLDAPHLVPWPDDPPTVVRCGPPEAVPSDPGAPWWTCAPV